MSDSTPMTPEEARAELGIIAHPGDPVRFFNEVMRALETIASMTVEEEHRIVPADSNGGIYQTRRWTRHVTEWKPQ